MMAKTRFHDSAFDEGTQTKLEIVRRYVREWVSTLLTRPEHGRQFEQLNLYDFFSGPGRDTAGVPGSPIIMVEEVANYCCTRDSVRAPIPVRFVFNDRDSEHVETLKHEIEKVRCSESCCCVEYSALPFEEALPVHMANMRRRGHANLVLMDQCGVNQVTPEVVRDLLACGSTDVLFFISSSFIHRFIDIPCIRSKLDVDPEEVKNSPYRAIHRHICDHFRAAIDGAGYLLAPFSIMKGANIYGLVFAASHRLAMEKFLNICWKLDEVTGQANYNIDGDLSWGGQPCLFDEMNKATRVTLFEKALRDYIREKRPTNVELYGFCLEQGFCASKAGDSLELLQREGLISVWDVKTQAPARKHSFYLKDKLTRVRFEV
jgi:three-Cys-motif partner protein